MVGPHGSKKKDVGSLSYYDMFCRQQKTHRNEENFIQNVLDDVVKHLIPTAMRQSLTVGPMS
jgi:hypothetical protein